MNAALAEILESPELPDIHAAIGQRLADERARRERFYEEITPEDKAEFINGEVIMHSPAQVRHNRASRRLVRLLGEYLDHHDLGEVFYEKILVVTERNDFEPDVLFYGAAKAAALRPEQMKLPPPDFVAEILSPSTEGRDRGVKFRDYAYSGVGEYWLLDPVRETVEVNVLEGRTYRTVGIFGGGEVRSEMVTGFVIPVRALFDDKECRAARERIRQTAPTL